MHPIEQARINCILAWEAHPEAKVAWCCHHDEEIEPLASTHLAYLDRINFIYANKPIEEQVIRLNNFRPVVSELPKELANAITVAIEAKANLVLAHGYAKTDEEYNAVYDVWAVKRDLLHQEIRNHKEELSRLHRIDVPDHTWNGTRIFWNSGARYLIPWV